MLAENDRDLDRALQLAQVARAQSPNESATNDTLGWVYLKRGMLPLATSNLEKAVQLSPTSAMCNYHLGVAYAKAGDDAKARKSLERALKLQPDFARAEDAKTILATLAF